MKKELIIKGRQPNELLETACKLLTVSIKSADALKPIPYTEHSRKNVKLVLGFLNAQISLFKANMAFAKLINLPEAIKRVEKAIKKRRR